MFLAAVGALATLSGLPFLLFPELAALSYDVIGRPDGRWARSPVLLVVTPTLVGALGVVVTQMMPYGLPAILLVVVGGIVIVRSLRSPIFPSLSAGILPLVFGIVSPLYPLAVLAATAMLAALSFAQRRGAVDGDHVAPIPEWPVEPRMPRLIVFLAFIGLAYGLAALTGLRLVLYPPLVVTAYVMIVETRICPWADKPLLLPIACLLTASGGTLAFAMAGSLLAVPLAAIIGIFVMRTLDLHAPPALAVALIPFVAPRTTIAYPLAVFSGTLLLSAVFVLARRYIGPHGHAMNEDRMTHDRGGATTRTLHYRLAGAEVTLQAEEAGSGPTVVLLPALSTISTRAEMRPLLERLAPDAHAIAVDWPGFGDQARPRLDWTPDILSDFLARFMAEEAARANAIIAAGHAASYALHHAVAHPGTLERLVLVAPTWRGPFPTMVKGTRPWFARLRAAVDAPALGPLLYAANISQPVLMRMAKAHVYSDPNWLAGTRLAEKRAVTAGRGARHASVRFVTGGLDRLASREAFLDLARRAAIPILVVYGDESPRKSRAEMEALADLPNVRMARLATGKLAVHEEFPDAVAAVVKPFLDEPSGP